MTRLTTCCPNCGHSSRVGDRYPWLGGLSGQQLEIMLALLDKPGMWFSSETLVRLLYAGKIEPEYADKNLNVLVYRIRNDSVTLSSLNGGLVTEYSLTKLVN